MSKIVDASRLRICILEILLLTCLLIYLQYMVADHVVVSDTKG